MFLIVAVFVPPLLLGLVVVGGVPLVVLFLAAFRSIKTKKIIRPTSSDSCALATAPQGLLKLNDVFSHGLLCKLGFKPLKSKFKAIKSPMVLFRRTC